MALFESLYILFKGDTTQLKSGLKDAKLQTDSLNRSLIATDTFTEKAGLGLSKLLKGTVGIIALAAAFRSVIDYSKNLYQASEALGVNIEALAAWNQAAIQAGGTAEGFQQSIKKFAETFNISATQALERFPQLADELAKLDKTQAFKVGRELGLDDKTIQLLQKGRKEVEEMIKRQKELGVVTAADAKIIHDFSLEWGNTAHVFAVFTSQISGTLLPIVEKLFILIQEFFIGAQRYPFIVEGITIALLALAAVLTGKLLLAFLPLIKTAGIFLAIGAAALLAYDDIRTFIEGGDSLLGRFYENFPKIAEQFKLLGDGILQLVDYILYAWKVLGGFSGSFKDFQAEKAGLGKGAELVIRSPEDIAKANTLTELDAAAIRMSQQLNQQLPTGPVPNPVIYGARNNSNRNTTVTVNEVNIETQATDTDTISKEISGALETQVRQAVDNMDDGVMI